MKTIKKRVCSEIIIKNSRFITILEKINSVDEINNILEKVRLEYKDATHYCYAYIIDSICKSSDDGEPGGTAGVPILQVLQKNDFNYVIAIVIRYFGGIKLGTGGLVRAYTKSVTTTIKENEKKIINLIKGYNLKIEFNYDAVKEIDYLLKASIINNKVFDEKIYYDININLEILDKIKNNKNIQIIYIKDKFIEEI